MERVLQLPPLRFGLPLMRSSPAGRVAIRCVAQAHRFVRAWGLRGAYVWAMERALQLPPLRFGLPLVVSEVAVGQAMVTRCVSEEAAE